MQSMSGDAGSACRHFDSSSPADLSGSVGMTADSSEAGGFCFKALPNVKANNSRK
jgi:hypothetical protein